MIKKHKSLWVLWSKDGTKILGTFKTREQAEKRENEILLRKSFKKK